MKGSCVPISAILFLCFGGTMVTSVPSGFHFNKSISSSVKLQLGVSHSHIYYYLKRSPVRMKNTMLRGNKLGIAAVLC